MKLRSQLIGLVGFYFAASSASALGVTCTNGTRDTVGDAYQEITFTEDALDVGFWESGFNLKKNAPGVSIKEAANGTIYTLDRVSVKYYGEGETWDQIMSGTVIYHAEENYAVYAIQAVEYRPYIQLFKCK